MSSIEGRPGDMAVPRHYNSSPPVFLLLSLLCQLIAFGGTLAALRSFVPIGASGFEPGFLPIFFGLLIYTTISWVCAVFIGLPPLWRLFNGLLLPLVIGAQSLALPAAVYGCGIAFALVLYLPTLWTRVPYYPTSPAMFQAVADSLPKETPVRFLDLGCGFAGLLCFLARARPESTFVGVELSPLAYITSKVRANLAGLVNVEIRFQSLWEIPLGDFTAVYAFLAPPPMAELWEKVQEEMPSDGLFLVNSFPVPGVTPEKAVSVAGRRQTLLYLYRPSAS